jgi:DNA sulfur modification protein DndB
MKKIVENKANWPLFRDVFNIPEEGEKGQAKNLKWMLRVNELRRIAAHPARDRRYRVEDFEYIDFVYDALITRIKEAQANPTFEMAASIEDGDD